MNLAEHLPAARVLPVITAVEVESTVELVRALQRGGMRSVEITLRTEQALGSIRAVKKDQPDMAVFAGTVLNGADVQRAVAAGADACISPGISAELLASAAHAGVPFLPGVASASEVMLGLEHGLQFFKLFPAVPVGGIALLKSLAGPFPDVRFCPTGGLNRDNFRDFLALPNVVCCGGSWMVSETLVNNGNWQEIEALAAEALSTGN
ncbi:MAG: bifunctional 4-hydroxy-2-oxoglutarate aldolase/2-dehydro-3-deoxy-phosphogluconate aldolase [Halioglobus sp.]